jgi:hypothetical protein
VICAEQLRDLVELYPGASLFSEGGVDYIFLPNAELPSGCSPARVDLLLCPGGRDGYASRLFAAQVIHCRTTPNWHMTAVIAGRTWSVFSWRVSQAGLTTLQILQAHMEALRK